MSIFESKEPIEEWMNEHFPKLWGAIPNDYYLDTEHFTDEVISELFREAMREWVKQQEPKAREGLSEKMERMGCDVIKRPDHWLADIWIGGSYFFAKGKTPLEAVQALEEQLKEGA